MDDSTDSATPRFSGLERNAQKAFLRRLLDQGVPPNCPWTLDLEELTPLPDLEAWQAAVTIRGEGVAAGLRPLAWLVPAAPEIRDREGRLWVSPLVLRPPEAEEGEAAPQEPVPDLERCAAAYAWADGAERAVRSFLHDLIRKARRGGENPTFGEWNLVRLEGTLNRLWLTPGTGGFQLAGEPENENPLRNRETSREVVFRPRGEGSRREGRHRLPHRSHEGVLCPFQTPESQLIGLELFRAVNSRFDPTRSRLLPPEKEEYRTLLSLATGLIPYPEHSDGPRLMMGGKNRKQAETGIAGASHPRVPGYLEGKGLDRVLEARDLGFDAEVRRFAPPMGTDAWMALMPWEGFTYQDGLVVSRSLAERMDLPGVLRVQRVPMRNLKLPREWKGRDPEEIRRALEQELSPLRGTTYRYDDPLPLPAFLGSPEDRCPRPRYAMHPTGTLEGVEIRVSLEREHGSKENRYLGGEVTLIYRFRCDLPLGLGDKLTGRHGNKGVVTAILEPSRAPVAHIGGKEIPLELMLSPCSVLGRKNYGQVLEMCHGLALWAREEGIRPDLTDRLDLDADAPLDLKGLDPGEPWRELLRSLGADGNGRFRVTWGDGRECRAFVGIQHIFRLHHHSVEKLQARGIRGPRHGLLDQPESGGTRTGQRFGEMELWSYQSHGADPFGWLDPTPDPKDRGLRQATARYLEMLGHRVLEGEESWRTSSCLEGEAYESESPVTWDLNTLRTGLRDLTDPKEDSSGSRKGPTEAQEGQQTAPDRDPPGVQGSAQSPSGLQTRWLFDLHPLVPPTGENVPKKDRIPLEDWVPFLEWLEGPCTTEDRVRAVRLLEARRAQAGEKAFPESSESGKGASSKSSESQEPLRRLLKALRERPDVRRALEEEKTSPKKPAPPAPTEAESMPRSEDLAPTETQATTAPEEAEQEEIHRRQVALRGLTLLSWPDGRLALSPRVLSHQPDLLRAVRHLLRQARNAGLKKKADPSAQEFLLLALASLRYRLLEGFLNKTGLVRRYLLGRRRDHSGRGVIVPAPDLRVDELRLPRAMLQEMIRGLEGLEDLTRRLEEGADAADRWLRENPFWVLAVRQPSLHRHSLASFRARCGEGWTLGLPPFATAGFNADFDGDTMAVFLPRDPRADLASMSLPHNPGLVGTGDPAFETELDLALGWHRLGEEERATLGKNMGLGDPQARQFVGDKTLGEALALLLEASSSPGELGDRLLELQRAVCAASTGACSLGPLELHDLYRHLQEAKAENAAISDPDLEERAASFLRDRKPEDAPDQAAPGDLAILLDSKAKGNPELLRISCGRFGEATPPGDDRELEGTIESCLWGGLEGLDLFRASYGARSSMMSKKLSVARAGYFSRLLAEGLYETRIEEEDCGAAEGLGIRWDEGSKELRLRLGASGKEIPFPLLGGLGRTLERLAWGRCVLGTDRILSRRDLRALADHWEKGAPLSDDGKIPLEGPEEWLVLRSPLTCRTGAPGVCARCAGADLAGKPRDRATLQERGRCVGLTAAQAIGERGTQLAMKKFHGGTADAPIEDLQRLLVEGIPPKDPSPGGAKPKCYGSPKKNGEKRRAILEKKLRDLISLLTHEGTPRKEMPQAWIHFELALRPLPGLQKDLIRRGGAWTLLAYEARTVRRTLWGAPLEDPLRTRKARLLWARG